VTTLIWIFPRVAAPDPQLVVPDLRALAPVLRAVAPDLHVGALVLFAVPESVLLASAPALFEEAQHFVLRIPLTPQAP